MGDSSRLRLHFTTRYERRDRQRWRVYTIHASDGSVLFAGEARRVPGPLSVRAAATGEEVVSARPRRSFPLSGRYDAMRHGQRIGVLNRMGRIRDADGRTVARFRDARSLKEHVGEGVLTMIVEGILAGESGSGDGPGPSGYVLMAKDGPLGSLKRERLPFEVEQGPEPRRFLRAAETVRRVLRRGPRKAGRRPAGWTLDVPGELPMTEPLLLAATILAIEIALW